MLKENDSELIGKSLKEVEKMIGSNYRVMYEDGKVYGGTCDYVPERYNFSIERGIIVEVSMG